LLRDSQHGQGQGEQKAQLGTRRWYKKKEKLSSLVLPLKWLALK